MPTKAHPVAPKDMSSTSATKSSLPQTEPAKMAFSPHKKRMLPDKSVAKARKLFANFSLSKFARDSLPPSHVPAGKGPETVNAAQRKNISRKIAALKGTDATNPNPGMTLALPEGKIKNFLPSYNEKAGTLDLGDVLQLMTQKMKGTQFFTNGNPTLNRMALQSQVDQIINSVKQGAKK